MIKLALAPFALLLVGAASPDEVSESDRLAHDQMLVLDTHLDSPAQFDRPGWDFADHHRFARDGTQVDLPRMIDGGLDGGFFVIYTPSGDVTPAGFAKARNHALLRAAAIRRVVAENRGKMELAYTADDARRIAAAGKVVVFQSMENSLPIGNDLSMLESFYRLGVRMAGPVHSKNNQLADSTTDTPRWKGLSPLGKQWVAEMNRLGMVIDGSHSSDAAFDQMLALSRAPIILSHSGPRVFGGHPRSIDDDRMRALAAKGGVMQLNSLFYAPRDDGPERKSILDRQEKWLDLTPAERTKLIADREAREEHHPFNAADYEVYIKALLHSIRVMGIDHVGLGADWDGGGGVPGFEDIALLPQITARLRKEGFSDADIAKVMGGNTLRLVEEVQRAAAR